MATRYRITHHSGEFDCPHCGAPVYVGDSAYDTGSRVFCSKTCAAGHEEYRRKFGGKSGPELLRDAWAANAASGA